MSKVTLRGVLMFLCFAGRREKNNSSVNAFTPLNGSKARKPGAGFKPLLAIAAIALVSIFSCSKGNKPADQAKPVVNSAANSAVAINPKSSSDSSAANSLNKDTASAQPRQKQECWLSKILIGKWEKDSEIKHKHRKYHRDASPSHAHSILVINADGKYSFKPSDDSPAYPGVYDVIANKVDFTDTYCGTKLPAWYWVDCIDSVNIKMEQVGESDKYCARKLFFPGVWTKTSK